MDKAQIHGQPFVYVLIAIVSIIIIAIGVQQIVKIDDRGKDIQIVNFVTSVKNEIKAIEGKPFGSEESKSFSLFKNFYGFVFGVSSKV